MPQAFFSRVEHAFGLPYRLRRPDPAATDLARFLVPLYADGSEMTMTESDADAARTRLLAEPRWYDAFMPTPYTTCQGCGTDFPRMAAIPDAEPHTRTVDGTVWRTSMPGYLTPDAYYWCPSCAHTVSDERIEDWANDGLLRVSWSGDWELVPDEPDDDDYEDDDEEGASMPTADNSERIDQDGDPLPPNLTLSELESLTARIMLDPLPDRRSRTVSYEMEVGMGGSSIASRLHDLGLAASAAVGGYHTSTGSDAFVHVERDGSVNAEVIWRMMRLDREEDASRLATGLYAVRRMQDRMEAGLDTRCGGHLHVDASRTSMGAIVSLYHLFCGLEDTLYQISGSHWPGGHRAEDGNSYADGPPKGAISHQEIFRTMRGGRYGINMSPYLRAMSACTCDAYAVGMWDRCTCTLPHPTIEFRLWNATTNLRKLRAHIALSIALIDYAIANPGVTETFLPEHGFMRGRWLPSAQRRPGATTIDRTRRALSLILNDLPLGPNERTDVLYCLDHSLLGLPQHRERIAPDGFGALVTVNQTVAV